jgi:hypothetical protein
VNAESGGLLVGAFERDNFGDHLLLRQTRQFTGAIPAVAGSLVAGTDSPAGSGPVVGYTDFLETAGTAVPWMWVVGGEVGAISVEEALALDEVDQAEGRPDLPHTASPYLPRPSRYASAAGCPYVVNSVGLQGLRTLPGPRLEEALRALQEATFLSVRDAPSRWMLLAHGIPNRLAPDIVHTLRPVAAERDRGLALVQAKARLVEDLGVRPFARALVEAHELRRFRLRLFSAGEAKGHDSIALLHEIMAEMKRLGAGDRVDVSNATTVDEKALAIAEAGLWLGTSLHGYILAVGCGVPCVGLMTKKVLHYAKTWGIDAPAAVAPDRLGPALSHVLSARGTSDRRRADWLAELAAANARAAVRALSAPRAVQTGPQPAFRPRAATHKVIHAAWGGVRRLPTPAAGAVARLI